MQSDIQIEQVPINACRSNPKHPRKLTARLVKKVAASCKAFGVVLPIVLDADNMIIDGHILVEALWSLGYTHVPAVRVSHLSPAQSQALGIALNRLAELGEWDDQRLGELFRDLSVLDLDFSLDVTGFEHAEIDLKIGALDAEEGPDRDDDPVDPGPPVTRLGDIFILGKHRVMCGSSLDRETYNRLMLGELAAIVVADLPYNCAISGHVSTTARFREFAMASGEMSEDEFYSFMLNACSMMAEFSADGALVYNFMDWRNVQGLLRACDRAFDALMNICVWVKPNGGMGSFYRSAHEMVVVSKSGSGPHQNHVQLGRFGRDRRNTWFAPGANTFLKSGEEAEFMGQHPSPKPVQLIADILMDASRRGEIVLDPFAGSGSTLIAAERLGRRCRTIDLDPLYCDLVIRRWQRHTGQVAVREDDVTFPALEAGAAR